MKRRTFLAILLFLTCIAPAWADVHTGPLFSEGMVLQRDREAAVWGTADAGEKITVSFRGQDVSVVADGGHWSVKVKTGSAGGPFPLTIAGKNSIVLKNVRVGEVWLCSGQSNMGFQFAPRPGSKERLGTENADIRLFTVPAHLDATPQTTMADAHWEECGPETVGSFSAVAYYFGRDLQKDLKVPIGLIHASYGGSSAALWMTPDGLATTPGLDGIRARTSVPKLYNGMIAPLIPYGIRGVIWYQGEADTGQPALYQSLFSGVIRGWRAQFGQGDFPFLFVQIAPFKKIVSEPGQSDWAELREAQRLTSLAIPNTAMVVITDWGHETQIHVRPKEPVGQRLALAARGLVYGEAVEFSGPTFSSMKIEGNKTALKFDHVAGGLETRAFVLENVQKDGRSGETGGAMHVVARDPSAPPEPLKGFAIAGADQRFVNANAEIRGDQVIVWSSQIEHPVAVRFGWADYPLGNLFNKQGLPASPFRTDDFPLVHVR